VSQVMEAVLGFFSQQDEDLLDACPYRSGGSVVFRSVPPMYSTGASCLEFTGSDKIRSCAPVFFLRLFGFRGRVTKLCWLLSSWGMFSHSMVKLAGKKCHGRRDLGTSNGDLTLCGNDELAG
jgi:hypothetical protein